METCDFDSWHPTLPVKFSLLHSISISRDTGGINTVGSLSGPHSRAVNLFDIGVDHIIDNFPRFVSQSFILIDSEPRRKSSAGIFEVGKCCQVGITRSSSS
ncbi:uncharacterized protein LOC108953222 [Musa acuminata AAA Group]|uniref:uncharacterized protein LOC108953222 n=1 Tax=Musa acuminata AAA Group TaxID=214697 RepID=UPI0031DE56E2